MAFKTITVTYKTVIVKCKTIVVKYKTVAVKRKTIVVKYKTVAVKYKTIVVKCKTIVVTYKAVVVKCKTVVVKCITTAVARGIGCVMGAARRMICARSARKRACSRIFADVNGGAEIGGAGARLLAAPARPRATSKRAPRRRARAITRARTAESTRL